ncbi:MAG: hypothetical protein IJ286_06195 [Alistipes sp.]|nr:hypothetical protein [Alistipes sp.]
MTTTLTTPNNVDEKAIIECMYCDKMCRCKFNINEILYFIKVQPFITLYHKCNTKGCEFYTITVHCSTNKLEVEFAHIKKWEVNDKITREILITTQYRVNRYLVENGYEHLFFGWGNTPSDFLIYELRKYASSSDKQRIKDNCIEKLLLEGIINNNKPMFLNEIKEQIRVLDWLVFDEDNITPPATLTKNENGKWVVDDKPYLQAIPVDDDLSALLANKFYGHTILVENLNIHHYRMNNNYKLELVDSYLLVFDTGELEELEVVFDNWKKEHPRK